MKQAEFTNIIFGPWAHAPGTPSPIERLWNKYQVAANEKARICAGVETAAEATTEAVFYVLEAAADAAFNVREDIGDEILRSRPTSDIDLGIQSRVLMRRDHGNGYLRDDVERFCRNVQIAVGSILSEARL